MPLSRRDFARLAAAAMILPRAAFSQSAPARKVRYAAVGLGRITADHFMPGTKQSAHGEITALVSGHPEKAKKLATQYGIPDSSIYSYENMDQFKKPGKQVILFPEKLKSGEFITPFEAARK